MALFAIRGFLRGFVAQVFVLLGVAAGLWAGAWTFHGLGSHWAGASPRLLYEPMRWLVSGLAALALASLLQLWGGFLGQSIRATSFAPADRAAGIPAGASIGLLVATVALLAALSVPSGPTALHGVLARSTSARVLLLAGEWTCRRAGGVIPGGAWLADRFRRARHGAREGRWVHAGPDLLPWSPRGRSFAAVA